MADGVRISIELDDSRFRAALDRALVAAKDIRPALVASADYIESSVDIRFDTGQGPGGAPWIPSRRAQEQGGKTLVDKGNLRESIINEVRANEVEVGVDGVGASARYARTHQFGATIRPKSKPFLVFTGADGGLVFAREVTIPARPFLGFDTQDVAELSDLWTDFAREPWQ